MPLIKLKKDEPFEGALIFNTGKHRDSNYPGRAGSTMYTLASGEVLILDEDVHQEPDHLFRDAGIQPGQLFRITLRKARTGAQYYELRKVSDAAEPARDIPPTKLESQIRASIDHLQAQRANPSKAPATPPRNQESTGQAHVNLPPLSAASKLVASAMVAAIDGMLTAAEYAKDKKIPVKMEIKWSAEDVRAIANTLIIQGFRTGVYAEPVEQKVNGGAKWPQ